VHPAMRAKPIISTAAIANDNFMHVLPCVSVCYVIA
jgi:hypothetical protein